MVTSVHSCLFLKFLQCGNSEAANVPIPIVVKSSPFLSVLPNPAYRLLVSASHLTVLRDPTLYENVQFPTGWLNPSMGLTSRPGPVGRVVDWKVLMMPVYPMFRTVPDPLLEQCQTIPLTAL